MQTQQTLFSLQFVTAIKLHNLAVVKFLVEDEFIFPGKEALACALIVGDWGIIKYLLPLMNAIEFVNEEER